LASEASILLHVGGVDSAYATRVRQTIPSSGKCYLPIILREADKV